MNLTISKKHEGILPCVPEDYTKLSGWNTAIVMAAEFCALNGLDLPTFINSKITYGYRGYYQSRRIVVDVEGGTILPNRNPGFGWTFPGYKADLTALGVGCHEFGHYVQDALGWKLVNSAARVAGVLGEERVSGYEPNAGERFAECFRLFMTNPDLLRVGRPKRWAHLTTHLGLKPVHDTPWREIFAHASPRFISAAESWIRLGRKDAQWTKYRNDTMRQLMAAMDERSEKRS